MRRLIGWGAVGFSLGAASLILYSCSGESFTTANHSDASVGGSGNASGAAGAVGCAADEKSCDGACKKLNNPTFGCASTDCAPCSLPFAIPICKDGACAIGNCQPDRGDCDNDAANGCEASLNSDQTCGSCFTSCTAPQVCSAGSCVSDCPSGQQNCGGCTDVLTDPGNCGTCGNVCAGAANAEPACSNGNCTINCVSGYGDCDGDPTNGCETTVNLPDKCGSCTTVCPSPTNAYATCESAGCGFNCKIGFENCDEGSDNGCEINLKTDPNNCGQCSKTCTSGGNPGCCAGNCVDFDSSLVHCGKCAHACNAIGTSFNTPSCASGVCTYKCLPTMYDCDGNCTNGCECTAVCSSTSCKTTLSCP